MAQLEIVVDENNRKSCGGSIISNFTILTAAHCVFGIKAKQVTVRIGSKYNDLGGELFKVAKIIVHPQYTTEDSDFDVALLILGKQIVMKPKVKEIVKLAAKDDKLADGTIVFVSGWGHTQNEKESNDKLRGVEVPVVNQAKCREAYPNLIKENMCAGYFNEGGKDSCQGEDLKCFEANELIDFLVRKF
jgi:trypsin